MVTKYQNQENQNVPPAMDEAWWESVLAEDEALNVTHNETETQFQNHVYPKTRPQNANKAESPPVDWEKAFELYEKDQVLELEVTGFNRGGLLVTGNGLHGFVPVSHLVAAPCNDEEVEEWLAMYTDRILDLKVIECDQERGRVVLSERAAQAEPGSRKKLLDNLQPGNCTRGTVTNITDFGVFVDLGGVEGLIHVSEISWGRVHHPADVVELGQTVEVFVIQVDQERARVALSLKRLYANPWETAEERYYPGQITEAVITSIVPFGAFARLEEGLDGLIHISEISNVDNPHDLNSILDEGQKIRVRVLHVDAEKQRLGLSLKIEADPLT